jgi:hypothetical protein
MTIQELGSLGELLAAIATLATLGYLAVQIRQNTRSVRTSTYQAIVATAIELGNTFARDGSFAEIFARGANDPDSLTAAERVRLQGHVAGVLRCYELVFHQFEHGAVDLDSWAGWRANMVRFLRVPCYAEVWEQSQGEFPPRFRSEVRRALGEREEGV